MYRMKVTRESNTIPNNCGLGTHKWNMVDVNSNIQTHDSSRGEYCCG